MYILKCFGMEGASEAFVVYFILVAYIWQIQVFLQDFGMLGRVCDVSV